MCKIFVGDSVVTGALERRFGGSHGLYLGLTAQSARRTLRNILEASRERLIGGRAGSGGNSRYLCHFVPASAAPSVPQLQNSRFSNERHAEPPFASPPHNPLSPLRSSSLLFTPLHSSPVHLRPHSHIHCNHPRFDSLRFVFLPSFTRSHSLCSNRILPASLPPKETETESIHHQPPRHHPTPPHTLL